MNSYRQDLLPTCKAFPKETTTCIWFTQSCKVCNSTTVLQEGQMLWPDMAVRAIKDKVLLVHHTIQSLNDLHTRHSLSVPSRWTLSAQQPVSLAVHPSPKMPSRVQPACYHLMLMLSLLSQVCAVAAYNMLTTVTVIQIMLIIVLVHNNVNNSTNKAFQLMMS